MNQFGAVFPVVEYRKANYFAPSLPPFENMVKMIRYIFTHKVFKDTTGTKNFINSHKFEK